MHFWWLTRKNMYEFKYLSGSEILVDNEMIHCSVRGIGGYANAFLDKGMQHPVGVSTFEKWWRKKSSRPTQGCLQFSGTRNVTCSLRSMTIHVDDILVLCGEGDFRWFQEITNSLVMKSEGPFNYRSPEKFYYLKKEITLKPEGVFIRPNPAYTKKMVEMLKLDNKKVKALPHDAQLEVHAKGM